MGLVRYRRRIGGRSLAAALLGATFLIGLAGPALADSHLESENAELRSQIEDLRQEVQILKNMVVEQGNKMRETGEPAAPAKMVTSGKDKVSLSVSGQVNRMLLYASDGNRSRIFHADNDQSSTRFRMKGKAKLDNGLSAGATFEAEFESNSSGSVSLGDKNSDDNKASLKERKLEIWFKSKQAGKLSIGQGSTASDGTIEEDLSGTGVITSAGFAGTGDSLEFVDAQGQGSGVTVGDLFSNMDGLSRKDRLRYDSPSFGGFQVSASHLGGLGDGSDAWDVALRYGRAFGDFEIAAALSRWVKDDKTTGQGGSVSLLAPSGTSLTLATSSTEKDSSDTSPSFSYAKLGQSLDLNSAGSTSFSIGYGDTSDQGGAGNGGSYMDIAVVQKIKGLGAEIYAVYGIYEAGIAGMPTNDINISGLGARIKF